jgi:hypothetical protein
VFSGNSQMEQENDQPETKHEESGLNLKRKGVCHINDH